MLDNPILIALGTSLATAFGSWVFFIRKHKAEAVGTEKTNDRTEIENYKLIATEWRETAQRWKELADKYETELIESRRIIPQMRADLEDQKRDITALKGLLTKAQNRISELEKH